MISDHIAQQPVDLDEIAMEEAPVKEQRGVSENSNQFTRRQGVTADVMKAHTVLMEKVVLLSAKQGDLFRLVQHHYHRLQSWHDQYTGWRIQRSSTVIRLLRHPSSTTPGYLYERLKEPKDFACLTWLLWYAENRQLTGRGNEQQFLLSQFADQMQEQSTQESDSAAQFDFRRPADRYSIQRALQYLEDIGGLQLVDGQTREWVEQTGSADVLYEFTDVARSFVSALNMHVVETASTHLSDPASTLQPTLLPAAVTTPPLMRAWRTLLLGPALFRFDDPAAYGEMRTHADAIANELLETFGWLLDIQRDYACIVRASGMSTGPISPLTPYGTNDQIAMLLCQAIRQQVESGAWTMPDSYGCLHITMEDVTALLYTVRERYGEKWGNEARSKSSRSLLNDVYKKMRQAGLLRGPDEAGNILILPTAARYAVSYEKVDSATPVQKRSRPKTKRVREAAAVELPGLAM
jgi:uncharacterized protein (TIGR02678 family)